MEQLVNTRYAVIRKMDTTRGVAWVEYRLCFMSKYTTPRKAENAMGMRVEKRRSTK